MSHGKVRTVDCPECRTRLQWLVSDGELQGLKLHWDYLHKGKVDWLDLVRRVQS